MLCNSVHHTYSNRLYRHTVEEVEMVRVVVGVARAVDEVVVVVEMTAMVVVVGEVAVEVRNSLKSNRLSNHIQKEVHLNKLHQVIKYKNRCHIRILDRSGYSTFQAVYRCIVGEVEMVRVVVEAVRVVDVAVAVVVVMAVVVVEERVVVEVRNSPSNN